MKTTTILAVIGIISAVGIVGTTMVTGILSQHAHAAACNSRLNVDTGDFSSKCSSPNSLDHANTINDHLHQQGFK